MSSEIMDSHSIIEQQNQQDLPIKFNKLDFTVSNPAPIEIVPFDNSIPEDVIEAGDVSTVLYKWTRMQKTIKEEITLEEISMRFIL